ncbi:hypothetical protein JHK85_024923 [Glycine max]|nr:hypothetical protein JHK85_024923 [Glycine max]
MAMLKQEAHRALQSFFPWGEQLHKFRYHQHVARDRLPILGTMCAKNVISACQECRVRCLIYNDSVDVVDGGLHDIHDGDEWLVSTWKTNNTLNDLKAQVEALILSANDIDGVLTCSLRPSNVFGLGDPEFVPYFLKLSRYGFSKFDGVMRAVCCKQGEITCATGDARTCVPLVPMVVRPPLEAAQQG